MNLDKLIIEKVSEKTGVSINDIVGNCRKQEFVKARSIASVVFRDFNYTHLAIAICLGRQDHATAINWQNIIDTFPGCRNIAEEVIKEVTNDSKMMHGRIHLSYGENQTLSGTYKMQLT